MRKLRSEVVTSYGHDGLPSTEDMRELTYRIQFPITPIHYVVVADADIFRPSIVRAVINETMRLFPPVPMNLRLSDNTPHAFPSSANSARYFVPPNTVILYTTFLIQRRADLWGDDAHEFRPERWLEPETIKHLADNPFMFHPFHAGPRLVHRFFSCSPPGIHCTETDAYDR